MPERTEGPFSRWSGVELLAHVTCTSRSYKGSHPPKMLPRQPFSFKDTFRFSETLYYKVEIAEVPTSGNGLHLLFTDV